MNPTDCEVAKLDDIRKNLMRKGGSTSLFFHNGLRVSKRDRRAKMRDSVVGTPIYR